MNRNITKNNAEVEIEYRRIAKERASLEETVSGDTLNNVPVDTTSNDGTDIVRDQPPEDISKTDLNAILNSCTINGPTFNNVPDLSLRNSEIAQTNSNLPYFDSEFLSDWNPNTAYPDSPSNDHNQQNILFNSESVDMNHQDF